MHTNAHLYEAVIGLEIHAQLLTKSKLFSADEVSFGAAPNTQVSEIVLAHPGTLPKTNKQAVELAVTMGLACNCAIEKNNYFARKNYFYADLPKGYQISQHTTPICVGGFVTIHTKDGKKDILLNRIHLEEDAGKSIHDADDFFSLIDLNRAGTALIEIVTEPCIHSSEEAYLYVTEIRKLVQWLGVCDGNMEEGSLRCDANISIRKKGDTQLGTKVEVKNLNSIRNVKKAIDIEIERMIAMAENGETIVQQTRSFDANNDSTFAIRDKEDANDYRYFADPDLPPFVLSDDFISQIKNNLPALPWQLKQQLIEIFLLNEYDATQLSNEKETADYFFAAKEYTANYKAIANWLNGPLKEYCNAKNISINQIPLHPKTLAEIIALVDEGKVNFSVASGKLLLAAIETQQPVQELVESLNLVQTNDSNELAAWIDAVLTNMPDKVAEYKKGKKGLIGLFVGEVKKLSKGKADPKLVTEMLQQKLQ